MMLSSFAVVVLLLAWWLTGQLCTPGSRLYLLDHPNDRSLHHVPTPRTGGLAILGSVLVGLSLATVFGFSPINDWWRSVSQTPFQSSLWILGMTFLLGGISFLDDRGGLPASLRIGVQLVAALGVVGGAGLTIQSIAVPVLGTVPFGWMAVPVTLLFLLWMTNLYNFMDGMDGFAGGMTVLGFGFLAYFAWQGRHPFILLMALLVAMGAAGFLAYNLPPARIFMGDVGSVSVGFLAAALITLGIRDRLFDVWIPIIIFSPFILDATITVLRRAFQGEKIWEAHRTHYYQRLVLAGLGHRKAVFAEYVLMLACGGAAVAYAAASELWRLAILGAWAVTFIFLAKGVRSLERRVARLCEQQ